MKKTAKTGAETWAYLRTSTDDQVYAGTIQTQRAEIEKRCLRDGVVIDCWLDDDGVSGAIPIAERPAGSRLMKAVDDAEVGTLIVYRLDRLGREDYDILSAVAYLRRRKVNLVSATECLGDDTPAGRGQIGMLAVFACMEKGIIRERTMHGRQRRGRQGGWCGGRKPFGYTHAPRGGERGTAEWCGSVLVPDPETAPIARSIFDAVVASGRSLSETARWLNRIGVRPPRGQKVGWTQSAVHYIVRNPVYKGEFQFGDPPITVPVEPIVPEDLWSHAQEQLEENKHRRFAANTREYLLSGRAVCAHCGRRYVGAAAVVGGKEYRYYRCNSFHDRHANQDVPRCEGRQAPADDIDRRVMAEIAQLLDKPVDLIRRRIRDAQPEPTQQPAELIAVLEDKLAAIDEHRQEVIALRAAKLITDDDLKAQLERMEASRAELAEELQAARDAGDEAAFLDNAVRDFEATVTKTHRLVAGQDLLALSVDRQRQLVQALDVTVYLTTVPGATRRQTQFNVDVEYPVRLLEFGPPSSSSAQTRRWTYTLRVAA